MHASLHAFLGHFQRTLVLHLMHASVCVHSQDTLKEHLYCTSCMPLYVHSQDTLKEHLYCTSCTQHTLKEQLFCTSGALFAFQSM